MVSAIISAYKTDIDQLDNRLDNLAAQGDVEVIAVCQDGSAEYDLLFGDGRVSYLSITPDIPTVYGAWNLGIRAATQEFVTNANSDDLLYPEALSIMVQALKDNPDYALVYGYSDIVKTYQGPPVGRYIWMEGGHAELLERCFIGPMPVWRKSLHEKYGWFDEEMHSAGDYEFWLRLASSGEKFLYLKRCFGSFLSNQGSASMREPVRSVWEAARARSRYPLNKEI